MSKMVVLEYDMFIKAMGKVGVAVTDEPPKKGDMFHKLKFESRWAISETPYTYLKDVKQVIFEKRRNSICSLIDLDVKKVIKANPKI